MNKVCSRCKELLIVGENWYPSYVKRQYYRCKYCVNEYRKGRGYAARERYRQSPVGREAIKRGKARRKGMGFVPMLDNPFDDNEPIEWHHIDDECVLAIPTELHQLYYTNNKEDHRSNCINVLKQIYGY
jgi:hypothetical protein